jgi:hypothetical protein
MLQLVAARIREEQAEELRAWLRSLAARRQELRESYERHGTRHELFLLARIRGLPILIVIAEVEDGERAARSFLRSELPIDLEFKELFQQISPEAGEIELLYDSSSYLGIAD